MTYSSDRLLLKRLGTEVLPFLIGVTSSTATSLQRFRHTFLEEGGFEPPDPCGSSVFKTDAFGRSATLPAAILLKLLEKVEVVFGEKANIGDAVFKENEPLDADAPGVASVGFGINAARF
jgi:hypothetical protein